jgi:predicted membrane protein
MKTVYANSSRPKLVKWSSIVAFVVGLVCILLYLFEAFSNDGILAFLYTAGFFLLYGAFFYGQYKLLTITIDEEADTITDSRVKKYPLKISELKYAAYKESKKGRFRSLFLHDTGNGFMDIRTNRTTAEKMVAQILKANPNVEIRTENFL